MKHLFLLICLILFQLDIALGETASPKSLRIGAVLGITGAAAFQADAVKKGVELGVEKLKAEGWSVDLALEDDQTNSAKSVTAIRSLSSRGYKIFIGPLWSFQIQAAAAVIEGEKALSLIPTGSSDVNGGPNPRIINLCPPRAAQKAVIEEWLRKEKIRSAVLLTPLGDWGELHRRVTAEAVAAVGGAVVGDEQFDYGIDAASARALLLRHRDKKFQLLFTTGGPGDVATIVKARNMLSIGGKVLSTEDLGDAVSLSALTAEDLRADFYLVELERDLHFRRIYKELFKEEPKLYADRGYESVMKIAEAVGAVGPDPERILAHLKGPAGINKESLFDQNGDATWGRYRIIPLAGRLGSESGR